MARKLLALPAMPAATLVPVSVTATGPAQAVPFKVPGFHHGTNDPAHIALAREANPWLTRAGQENGFTYEATTDRNRPNNLAPAQAQVVIFLGDLPNGAQRTGFRQHMEAAGGTDGGQLIQATRNGSAARSFRLG